MRRFVLGLFAAIGIVAVLAVLGLGVAIWRLAASRPSLPGAIVLLADLDRGLAAGAGQEPVSELVFGNKPTLRDFLDTLDKAGDDPRVKALYVRIGQDELALATCQEVRDAVARFRAKGKFAVAFSDSFGEFGSGTRPYYLATAFDEIWLQPLGSVGLIGLRAEVPFLRAALDKLGILPSFAHREQYKTAMNSLTETGMTPAQREETEDLLNVMSRQIVSGIATARKMSEERVRELVDRGPLLAEEAKEAKLIDRIGYRDEAVIRARRHAGSGAELVSISHYLDSVGRPHRSGPKIALIYGTGLITAGAGGDSLLFGSSEMSARKVTRAFRDAYRDSDVRAIVFRIDSPGGSAAASETIWREIGRARERGKPVVVSMGDVAGSGGYYIAAGADKIVAEPATLTGSIGVLAGKLVVAGLLQKLGVAEETVQQGANAAMFSALEDFSQTARGRLETFLDATYAGFKERVAEGRHLSSEQVEAVAKGRVWAGEEAKEKGLVDALGGYDLALRFAKEAVRIPANEDVTLTIFPRRKSMIERLYERVAGRETDNDSDTGEVPPMPPGILSGLSGLALRAEMLLRQPGILQMMPLDDIR